MKSWDGALKMRDKDQTLKEAKGVLNQSIHDIHNSATALQYHQEIVVAQMMLDGAGKLNLALNKIKETQ